jgi:hypothetical protein
MDTREFIEADFNIHYVDRMLKNKSASAPRAAVA